MMLGALKTDSTAQLYHLLSLTFRYPDEAVMEKLRGPGGTGLRSTLEELDGAYSTMGAANSSAASFVKHLEEANLPSVQAEYNRLWAGRPECSLYETEHDSAVFNRNNRQADIAGFYNAFGVEPMAGAGDRHDFVGVELEFMGLLLLKEAYAEEMQWPDHVAVCNEARRTFFREHLVWWIPGMCDSIRSKTESPYYRALARFLKTFVRREKALLAGRS